MRRASYITECMLLCCQRSGRAQATLLRLGLNNSSVPSSRTVSNSAVKNIASVSLMPSVCVFGAGAVGLHLAAALDQAGLGEGSLSLVCRGATYEQIKFSGMSFMCSVCAFSAQRCHDLQRKALEYRAMCSQMRMHTLSRQPLQPRAWHAAIYYCTYAVLRLEDCCLLLYSVNSTRHGSTRHVSVSMSF